MPLSIKWVNPPVAPGPPPPALLPGWKTNLTALAATGYLGYCWYNNLQPDPTVLKMFGFATVAALRSAVKTHVAQIVNATVAAAPKPPPDLPLV